MSLWGHRNLPEPGCINFPDVLSTICDTRLPSSSPIGFWNGLNLAFTMAGHFPKHSTSTIEPRLHPTPRFDVSGANCKIIDIFWRLEDAGKIRSTSFSGSENLKLRWWLEMSFLQLLRNRLEICNSVFFITRANVCISYLIKTSLDMSLEYRWALPPVTLKSAQNTSSYLSLHEYIHQRISHSYFR